jgi:hypothetical protein
MDMDSLSFCVSFCGQEPQSQPVLESEFNAVLRAAAAKAGWTCLSFSPADVAWH